jgi:exosortase A-associated hydrolase 2
MVGIFVEYVLSEQRALSCSRFLHPMTIPFFLSSTAGKLFCVYHEPSGDSDKRGDLIFLPPFAEELNQSRHTVVRMARCLARRGWGVLLLDLFGTGDSEGMFEECRWEIWRQDVMVAYAWLRDRGRTAVGLWGLRLGALLAADAAAAHPGLFSRLVLWQPVTSGKPFLNQFLRIRAFGALIGDSESQETRDELRQHLASGNLIHVAGYPLTPRLAQDLDELDMAILVPSSGTPVLWFEVVTASSAQLSPAGRRIVDAWQNHGVAVTSVPVTDTAFWSVQALEPVLANQLITATAEAL